MKHWSEIGEHLPYWIEPAWWIYVLRLPEWGFWERKYGWREQPIQMIRDYWTCIICRWRGHPCGVVFYSGGFEPNMTCKNCGDDLG